MRLECDECQLVAGNAHIHDNFIVTCSAESKEDQGLHTHVLPALM